MAPPVHYLRPGEASDIHSWLIQKMQEERREVLLYLENTHKTLLEQFLVRANQGYTVPLPSPRQSPRTSPRGNVSPFAQIVSLDNEDQRVNKEFELQVEEKLEELEEKIEHQEEVIEKQDETINRLEEKVQDGDSSPVLDRSATTMSTPEGHDPDHPKTFETSAVGQAFEWFFGFLIFANAIVMALNQQYLGLQRGYNLSYPTYVSSKDDAWPGGEVTFDIFEKLFTIMFTIEFIARWCIFKLKYLKDVWCYFDGIIVAFAWVIFFKKDAVDFNPTFVRLARVTKLLRLIRLLRSHQMFDSLKLLVAAINASFNILFWSLCVLLVIIMVGALFMVQTLEPYFEDYEKALEDTKTMQEHRAVFKYFGTFYRALLTMFEITFANWVVSMRVIVENVAEVYGTFYLLYRCVIGLAVLMVVQAVFIQQTMKATQLDDEALAHQKRKAKAKLLRRLENMFKRLDATGDGTLEYPEFSAALQNQEMAAMLEVFELEVSDIDVLFKLLDDGDGSISVGEFVAGVEHMKGSARAIDVMEIKKDVKKMRAFMMSSTSPSSPRDRAMS